MQNLIDRLQSLDSASSWGYFCVVIVKITVTENLKKTKEMKTKINNSIYAIEVYKHGLMWVFDDANVGLVKEPFVAGADTLIDILAGENEKITLIFSTIQFPDHKIVIERKETNPPAGTDYYCEAMKHELWLCPALNLYYLESPAKLYVNYRLNN